MARFARDPAGDRANLLFNLPLFLELLPPPGRATLDLACGEGRLGAELERLGHHVVGVDSSPGMVAAAAELIEAVVADAAELPFEDGAFDLVAAFMSLQDLDHLESALREAARVLEPSGRLCFCNLHPIATAGRFDSREPDSPFAIVGSYFDPQRHDDVVERDGFRITFAYVHRPLEAYVRTLERAGFLIEAIREPLPPQAYLEASPGSLRWQRVPLFLHVRALKP